MKKNIVFIFVSLLSFLHLSPKALGKRYRNSFCCHTRKVQCHHRRKRCGSECLKSINSAIGEIKRMYVDPSCRNVGAGRAILQSLLTAAIENGYKKVRLDSSKFMTAAHSLYRSVGFKEIPVYAVVEIPEAFRQYLLFMEIDLL